jgi:hypothetical protein
MVNFFGLLALAAALREDDVGKQAFVVLDVALPEDWSIVHVCS